VFWVHVESPDEIELIEEEQRTQKLIFNLAGDDERPREPVKSQKTTGRNESCPCGSGKKFKKCCGK